MIYLFRVNGGEVLSVSIDPTAYAGIDSLLSTVTNPPTPDGLDLAVPKIWDGTNLRNATAGEIATFVTAAATDLTTTQRNTAVARFQTDPNFRKVLRSIVGLMVTQLNIVRQNPTTVFAAITQAQAETAIVNAINAGTFD